MISMSMHYAIMMTLLLSCSSYLHKISPFPMIIRNKVVNVIPSVKTMQTNVMVSILSNKPFVSYVRNLHPNLIQGLLVKYENDLKLNPDTGDKKKLTWKDLATFLKSSFICIFSIIAGLIVNFIKIFKIISKTFSNPPQIEKRGNIDTKDLPPKLEYSEIQPSKNINGEISVTKDTNKVRGSKYWPPKPSLSYKQTVNTLTSVTIKSISIGKNIGNKYWPPRSPSSYK